MELSPISAGRPSSTGGGSAKVSSRGGESRRRTATLEKRRLGDSKCHALKYPSTIDCGKGRAICHTN
jgi:hypothetical protein